jgi:beta-lactamase regulating signal transducer with metallopeptidase domain
MVMLVLLLESSLRSVALGIAVWLALQILRVRNPHVQMTAWTAVLMASLAMPLLMQLPAPRLTVVIPRAAPLLPLAMPDRASTTVASKPLNATLEPGGIADSPAVATEATSNSLPAASMPAPIDWIALAGGLYLVVAGTLLLRLLIGLVLTWRLWRCARPLFEDWTAGVSVCVSDAVGMPVTIGSSILPPADCLDWSAVKRSAVLSHEKSHVACGDFLVLLLARLNRAVFWFNPLSWWLLRQLADLAETISDDIAIEVLGDRPVYAEVLLDVASHVRPVMLGITMARARTVRRRIERILGASALSSRISRRKRILLWFGLLPIVAVSAASIAHGTPPTGVQQVDGAQLAQANQTADQPARPEIGGPDRDSHPGIDADLTALKLNDILPGWVKLPGKSSHAVFNVVQKPQSTRFEDIVIDGGGVSIKGSLEVDQNGDLLSADFPVYSPSDGDKTTLKAERSPDGVLKLTMRGDVFDGRSLLKSAISGKEADSKSELKNFDLDVDLKLGTVAGYNGETMRDVDVKLSRRNGTIRSFVLRGKLGRDTPLTGDLRSRAQGRDVVYLKNNDASLNGISSLSVAGRDVMYLKTNDAGAFFRFTDTYAKMSGGQLVLAVEPPTVEPRAKEGLINIRDFSIKGERALDQVAAGGAVASQSGIGFSALRAEFTWQNGQLTVREGVVKGPTIGATIAGSIDYPGNHVRMSGTVALPDGINNRYMYGLDLFPGAGSIGLIGHTYEVVGSPEKPVININPLPAMVPGVLRYFMEKWTGKQNNPAEFPSPNSPGNH